MTDNKSFYALAVVCALGIGLFIREDVETKLFPVVGSIEVVQKEEISDSKQRVFVRFDKYRECEFVGLRMNDPLGYRVEFKFMDIEGDSYQSRPEGLNIAGPWMIHTNFPIEELKIEAIHRCKNIFGNDYKVKSVMNDGE